MKVDEYNDKWMKYDNNNEYNDDNELQMHEWIYKWDDNDDNELHMHEWIYKWDDNDDNK